ncbi:MAG: alanine racemase [Cyclobacteriaceae bacterium]
MADKTKASGVDFRPHFKTHQSASIGNWFRDEGIDKITVSSVSMAQYFASHGWNDITIAFPYNPLEHSEIEALARKINLNVLIESKEALVHLNNHINADLGYFIKIDVGTGRTGLSEPQFEQISVLIDGDNENHHFRGLLVHAGHSYQKVDLGIARGIYDESLRVLNHAKSYVGEDVFISYGDTPTCSLLESFAGVNEIRPGNFAFYDLMQHSFGSCDLNEIAVCMACPVVAIHPQRNEAIIYGGAVHFSKEKLEKSPYPYGMVIPLNERGWEPKAAASLIRVSQEHGIISGSTEFISSLKIGTLVGILPVHSCLTANLQRSYLSLDGREVVKYS